MKYRYKYACDVCDRAVTPPHVRCCCVKCGHRLKVHSDTLVCRVCKKAGAYYECGMDCRIGVVAWSVLNAAREREFSKAREVAYAERLQAGE